MDRDGQVREIKVLMDLVERSAPSLAPAEMQIDARAFSDLSFVYYLFPATVFFVAHDHFQLWRVYPVDEQNSVVYQSLYLPQPPAGAAV